MPAMHFGTIAVSLMLYSCTIIAAKSPLESTISTAEINSDIIESHQTCSNPDDTTCHTNNEKGEAQYLSTTDDTNENFVFDNDSDVEDNHYTDDDIDEMNENGDELIETNGCEDSNDNCYGWADAGECKANPNYMLNYCKRSCGTCTLEDLDLGVTQDPGDDDHRSQIAHVIESSHKYVIDDVLKNDELRTILELCKNEHELCSFWASIDECEKNPNYMKKDCSLACRSCDYHSITSRCPLDPDADEAWEPGDLNKMFERITNVGEGSEYVKYGPVVHSRPDRRPGDEEKEEEELDYKIGPWVVTFDSFLTDEECDRLVQMGTKKGYARSTNVGKMNADGRNEHNVDDTRTSENSWCDEECDEDDLISGVTGRIANVTGVPEKNQEYLQLLKYEVGQYYKSHHDYIEFHNKRQVGVRILTFFLYLNDVEEGGGTRFTDLDIISAPKKGKAVLWPSVLDSNPTAKDFKTHHEAMPVLKGTKYGANSWIHFHDFKGPFSSNCI